MMPNLPKILLAASFFLASLPIAAQQHQASPSADVKVLLERGLQQFEADDNAGAAATYEQALRMDPNSVGALTGLMYSCMNLKEYAKTAEACAKLLQLSASSPVTVYSYYGISLSNLGKLAEAEQVYAQGFARYPDDYKLNYNRGSNLVKQQKLTEAHSSFRAAVVANPQHARSHGNLTMGWLGEGARVPAILAQGRLLELNATAAQAAVNPNLFDAALLQGASPNQHGIAMNVTPEHVAAAKQRDNGTDDFVSIDQRLTALSQQIVAEGTKNHNPKVAQISALFSGFCRLLGEQPQTARVGFAWTYYAPFYVEMEKKGFVPAFVYLTHTAGNDAAASQQWLAAHPAEVAAFQEWSKKYTWPKPKL